MNTNNKLQRLKLLGVILMFAGFFISSGSLFAGTIKISNESSQDLQYWLMDRDGNIYCYSETIDQGQEKIYPSRKADKWCQKEHIALMVIFTQPNTVTPRYCLHEMFVKTGQSAKITVKDAGGGLFACSLSFQIP